MEVYKQVIQNYRGSVTSYIEITIILKFWPFLFNFLSRPRPPPFNDTLKPQLFNRLMFLVCRK